MIKNDIHQGKCGLCGTEVPNEATLCAGCGARWGSSTGKTRLEVYKDGKRNLKVGLFYGLALLSFYLVTIYLGSLWAIAAMVVGFLVGPVCLGLVIGGLLSMRKAKTNLKVDWWLIR
ncbi:hypothetical protein [Pleionea sediminis]|uniref:hypothetical protein n=1 Tax=Pleionea sediminis TaxID=2569479 RepID=UPI00197C4362|nr:hypothetical protein [Pleionea sediminis]